MIKIQNVRSNRLVFSSFNAGEWEQSEAMFSLEKQQLSNYFKSSSCTANGFTQRRSAFHTTSLRRPNCKEGACWVFSLVSSGVWIWKNLDQPQGNLTCFNWKSPSFANSQQRGQRGFQLWYRIEMDRVIMYRECLMYVYIYITWE